MSELSHLQARSIVERAWRSVHGRAPTAAETLFTMAIASLETGYGRAGQFGRLADQGLYNWGAEQTRPQDDGSGSLVCPAGTAPGGDTYQGAPVSVCFYVSSTDEQAAARIIRTLSVSFPARAHAIVAAMNSGSAADVARAMKVSPAYYTADESEYARGLAARASAVASAANLALPAAAKAAKLWLWLGLASAAGAGLWFWKKGRLS